MKLVNDEALDFARGPGWCDYCRRAVSSRSPHHVFSKGAGQIDAHFNIAALCDVFSGGLDCHHRVHTGEIDDDSILAMVATREHCHQDDIKQLVYLIRRLPKETTREQLLAAVDRECRPTARALAKRTL